jgi:hypothetical protein
MKKLGMMVLILLGAVTLLGHNYALAKGPQGHMWGKEHFDKMDTNKDGKISQDEHMAKCNKRFEAMDTNKDGFLTRDECGKGWEKRKEMMKEKKQKKPYHGYPSAPPSEPTPAEE